MSDNKRSGKSGKGYYIALILCAAAIGITSYVYQRNTKAIQEVALQETASATVPVLIEETEDVPALATVPKTTAPSPTVPPATTAPETPLKTMSPVTGEAIVGYSMEALSYNQTTRDWRVHNGVDIAAEAGSPVCAAADGEVYTVYKDDALGHTVVIRHNGGYTTRYSSLSEDVAVKAGDTVTMGAVIGYVSDSALVETTLGSHVHFSVSFQDSIMDPAEFLALGK